MARLSYGARKALPSSSFAGPGRSYPIPDASHARNALSRVSQFGSSAEKAQVRAKVHKRYPYIGKAGMAALAEHAAKKRVHHKRKKGKA